MPLESQCRWNHNAVGVINNAVGVINNAVGVINNAVGITMPLERSSGGGSTVRGKKRGREREKEEGRRKGGRGKKEEFILTTVDVLRCPLDSQNAQVIKIIAEIKIARRRTVLRRPSRGAARPRGNIA